MERCKYYGVNKRKFNVYDGRNTQLLVDKGVDIEADNARQALQKYLVSVGDGHIKFCNTADNDVIWKTTPFIETDGQKYQAGRISWWGVKPIKKISPA